MKWLVSTVFFALALAPAAQADDQDATALEGAYLLIQPNDIHRIIALEPGGTASLVGSAGQRRGYSSGLGAWEQTGPGQVTARIVDFNYDPESGEPTGTALNVYTLTFDDLEDEKYQSVTGGFSGEQFAFGQDPLNPTEDPVRTFGRDDFTGQRIRAK